MDKHGIWERDFTWVSREAHGRICQGGGGCPPDYGNDPARKEKTLLQNVKDNNHYTIANNFL